MEKILPPDLETPDLEPRPSVTATAPDLVITQPALFAQPRNFIEVIWAGLWLLYRHFSITIFVIAILAEIVRYYCLLNFVLHILPAETTIPTLPAVPPIIIVAVPVLIQTLIYTFSYTLLFLCLKDKLFNAKKTLATQLWITAKKFFPAIFLMAVIFFIMMVSSLLVGFVTGLITTIFNNAELNELIPVTLASATLVILAIYLSQTYSAFVLSASSYSRAPKYSYKLVKYSWWHVFFVYVAMSLLLMPFLCGLNFWLYGIIKEPFFLGYVIPDVNNVVLGIYIVLKAILALVSASILLAIFYNLRARKLARA